ncbi:hypothetical protein [Geminocystis sp. GBBB08]|uniref:hypothetical protein n=1 Tax=Geminocystis sp. GBBB08 TaxID=2604140 RepID=UPI0027E2AEB5|nr:hypothetical protein [Geminocystis sp. GBBB08]
MIKRNGFGFKVFENFEKKALLFWHFPLGFSVIELGEYGRIDFFASLREIKKTVNFA